MQTDGLLLAVRPEELLAFSEIPLQKVRFPCSWTLEGDDEVSADMPEEAPVPCEVSRAPLPAQQFGTRLNLPERTIINSLM